MDPISLMSSASSLIGMGVQVAGLFGAHSAASSEASTEGEILQSEMQENSVRQQAMVLSAQRMQTQNLRNTQRARAMGLAGAVNQGAQFGSGLAGGASQASAQGGYNALGISQNLQIGQQIFGIDNQIDQYKMQLANEQTQMSTSQGLMGLGGSIAGAGGPFGKLLGNLMPGGGSANPASGGMGDASGNMFG